VNEADLRGRAAHVERQNLVLGALGRDRGGEYGSSCRSGFHEADRQAARRSQAHQAAARSHELDGLAATLRDEGCLEAPEIAGHQRLYIGVRHGGRGALVLAHLRTGLG
jgi:hypothetical protein